MRVTNSWLMINMIKRFKQSEEGLDLIQLLIAVAILGALLAIGVLTLIGRASDAKKTASDASVANAVTATKTILAEGEATTAAAQDTAIEAEISGSDVTVVVATTPAPAGPVTLTGTNGASATVTQAGGVTTVKAS